MPPKICRRGSDVLARAMLALFLVVLSASGRAEEADKSVLGVVKDELTVDFDEFTIDNISKWRFQTSYYTKHFNPDDRHDNTQQLFNAELWWQNNWHVGAAFFDNSYGQPSQYFYVGKSWDIMGSENFYWRLTGGLLHGYKGEFEDKVPLNHNGFSPGIVPSIGAKYKNVFTEVQFGGISAIMLTVGFSLDNNNASSK